MANNYKSSTLFEARFQRYECKYLITEVQAVGIRNYMRPYVEVDPYGDGSHDQSYEISSLYLDAPDLRLYRETRNGVTNRIKLRIRTYSRDEAIPVFLEIKRRCNGLVLKARARLMRRDMETLLRGGAPDTSLLEGEERACYDEFLGWVGRWLAQPVVWVKYRREAYIGAMNPGVRITMDRRLVFAPSVENSGEIGDNAWLPIEKRFVVLELKFNTAFPDWMLGLVQRYGLKRTSFSKYGNAVLQGMDAWLFPPSLGPYARERNLGELA
ncbi:MAG: polyphosphate polymerase domain-containing protein [Planctomycetota bacterium]